MFDLIRQILEKTEYKQYMKSKTANYVFKDYDTGDFNLLITLWCFDEEINDFDYSLELKTLQKIYNFKQKPIFIGTTPDNESIKNILENVYRSIMECPLIDKSKYEKFLYDFCTLNYDALIKHKLLDEDYVKIAFALLFGENELYYNLTYLSLISIILSDKLIIKKITDGMKYIHCCISYLCYYENDTNSSEDSDTEEIISVAVSENNGSVSLKKFQSK